MSVRRILLIGGTGVFGKRLARHLARIDDIALIVSSRSADKAARFARTLNATIPVQGIALDHRKNLSAGLAQIRPFAVVDCSGPFQQASYDTAETILGSGAHLVDLADARGYLAGFADRLDGLARTHDVAALTGASSTPALSTCVVDHLVSGWNRVDNIDICITPGGKSEVGRAVIAAILSYAGRDVPFWRDGALTRVTGWTGARRVDIPDLGRRRVAPVETLDAEYLGPRHDVRARVSFSAGLESWIEQRGIEAMATLRKRGLLPRADAFIPALLQARKLTRIPTSDRGGMLVEVSGIDADGRFARARWSLIARDDHGPYIPILPAAAIVQKLLQDDIPTGAALAPDVLVLDDILAQMTPYSITTDTDLTRVPSGLFETRLGNSAYASLPRAVQAFHRQTAPPLWWGRADIDTGRTLSARFVARLFSFPQAGRDVPLVVRVDRIPTPAGNPTERWTRVFAGQQMTSLLQAGPRRSFTEKFGPFTFTLGLGADADGIDMPVLDWRLGPVPLPRILAPRSETREYQDDQGRFRFDVRLSAPVLGVLAHYRGWLKPLQSGQV